MKYLALVVLAGCMPVVPAAPIPAPIPPKAAPIVSRCECSWATDDQIAKGIFRNSWTKKNLNQELIPVAWNESYYNTHLDHEPSINGPYQTAFGPLGLKPSTAHLEWKASPKLRKEYPGLEVPQAFLNKFRTDVAFYNKVANTHWARLKRLAEGDVALASFGWRWGPGLLLEAQMDEVWSDQYVLKYRERLQALLPPALSNTTERF